MYAAAYSCFKAGSAGEPEMQSQKQQIPDSKKLFGPHAKLKLQNSPPVSLLISSSLQHRGHSGLKWYLQHVVQLQALENEVVLMQQLRERLGPYAAQEALSYHLRAARGKLNWAGVHL